MSSPSPAFRRALRGILASFVGLLLAVTVHFGVATAWSPLAAGLAVAAFAALRKKIDVLWVVLIGALVSVIVL
jgi:chromate transporter